MKKLLLLAITSTFSVGVWANCDNVSAHSADVCYAQEISTLKKQLNQTYANGSPTKKSNVVTLLWRRQEQAMGK